MKRSNVLTYAAMLALPALAACRSELSEAPTGEANPAGVAIEFTNREASNGMARSAGDLTVANLTEMTVYAHYTVAANFADVATTSAPNFMMNQHVTKDGSGWTYSPVKYWPAQGEKVSFFAITPAPGTGGIAAKGSYTGYPSFTVTPPATPAQQQDICVASALNRTKDDGKVPLHFAHAMAKVAFAARYKGATLAAGQYVKIKQLHLTQIAGSGTLKLNDSSFSWTANSSNLTNYFLSTGDLTTSELPAESETAAMVSTESGTLLLVPQTTPVAARIQLVAAFYDGTAEKEYEVTATLPTMDWQAGKQVTYSLMIDLNKGYMSLDTPNVIEENVNRWIYSYTTPGGMQTFTAPEDGYYLLEAWGARGGDPAIGGGAAGAYASGAILLKKSQNIFVYVGSCGEITGGWNGGGDGKAASGSNKNQYGGGGATDFRLLGGEWNAAYSLNSRIMVAAGGAGSGASQTSGYVRGHAAVGLYGDNPTEGGAIDGRQFLVSKADYWNDNYNTTIQSGFGRGGSASNAGLSTSAGGGSGWYGGSGGGSRWDVSHRGDAGGGSCFISGMPGCAAINPTATNTPRTRDAKGATTALNYSVALFGASDIWPDGAEILFSNISMVDGSGYEWNTGARADTPTGMPTMPEGNTGNGYARITLLQAN